jgi:hypothetical protein
MYPVVPAELIHDAMQLAMCFVSVVGAVWGLVFCGRA